MSLTPEEIASYSLQIDAILAVSDIQTVSAKKIRLSLQEGLSHDISHQKKAINDLISQRFDNFTSKNEAGNGHLSALPSTTRPSTNGSSFGNHVKTATPSKREGSGDLSDPSEGGPPKKKQKPAVTSLDDAAYAAQLQAELNNSARPTRGGGAKPKPTPKKKTPKKSRPKLTADDDSDLDSHGDEPNKTERGGAFNKPMWLSQPLRDLLGEESLSRPKTVKGIWAYIKEHDLQNPNDKRQIMCDNALRAVFKKDEVHMFTMNKILSNHLTPMDD